MYAGAIVEVPHGLVAWYFHYTTPFTFLFILTCNFVSAKPGLEAINWLR